MSTLPDFVRVMLALPQRSTSCSFALTIKRWPSVGALHAAHNDRTQCVGTLEYQNDFPAYVSAVDILRGTSGHGRIATLPRKYHERRSPLVLEADQYPNDCAVKR
jgi:hypothetical protein